MIVKKTSSNETKAIGKFKTMAKLTMPMTKPVTEAKDKKIRLQSKKTQQPLKMCYWWTTICLIINTAVKK